MSLDSTGPDPDPPATGFRRIVCLTEETAETLYLLGAGDRVVGVSGFTVRPPEARRKPRVSSFLSADLPKIRALEPDLVLAFSDLQAPIVADLMREGFTVVGFNQRSLEEILSMIAVVGALAGCPEAAAGLVARLRGRLDDARERARRLPRRPRVFFEEWPDPLISGIRWVSEIVEAAGGDDIFPELRTQSLAKGRVVDPDEVVRRDPELVLASWCGRKVRASRISSRPGWDRTRALREGRIVEIKSAIILQPGPAALTDGLDAVERAIAQTACGSGPD